MIRWRFAVMLGLSLSVAGLGGRECCAQPLPQFPNFVVSAREPKSDPPAGPPPNLPVQETSSQSSMLAPEAARKDSIAQKEEASVQKALHAHLLHIILQDQKAIWTSPADVRLVDADWLIPLGAAAGIMFATDTEYSKHLSNSPSRIKYSGDVSNYGIGALAGIGAGFYFLGYLSHDAHKRETGFLAGEAAVDALVPTYALKYAFGRERPLQDDYQGDFFKGGGSFPSEHSAAAWSIASVIAHEYPGPLTSILAYGAASAISLSRVDAKQHFPSDV